ncbi:glycosyltransferase family 2 protein [Arthrobacter vasquezii]|uniref:glycosyltransferase family 2 protein n=1 Tax=Arthrobacter vasquezii TaxID=2977629 RepID=UPI00384E0CB4
MHTPDRQIERAVSSLESSGLEIGENAECRITVVCHNTAVDPIRRKIEASSGAHVRFLHLEDGNKSPAGPFNLGFSSSTASWVMIMGSDDTLEADALRRWLFEAESTNTDVLIAPEAHFGGASIHTPVVRWSRRKHLDPVSDRLAYRTAPLGLIRRELIEELDLRFPMNMANGSDQAVSARLWFSNLSITYGRGLPRYLVHDDATERVTFTLKDLEADLLFVTELMKDPWFHKLSGRSRHAIVTKLIRVHLFSHVGMRAASGAWDRRQATQAETVLQTLLSAAPRALKPLSIADRTLVDAIASGLADPTAMAELCAARRRFKQPRTWAPRDVRYILHREAPPRFMVASALV